jgi:hypothetical protein
MILDQFSISLSFIYTYICVLFIKIHTLFILFSLLNLKHSPILCQIYTWGLQEYPQPDHDPKYFVCFEFSLRLMPCRRGFGYLQGVAFMGKFLEFQSDFQTQKPF